MKDLWGNDIVCIEPVAEEVRQKKRKKTIPNGYAAAPGTGPKGETCKTCANYSIKRMGGTYRKCYLARARWTAGPGTDILAKSPACHYWKPNEA